MTRTAIVTGGSTGIGVAICRSLLDQGCNVVSLARRPAGLSSPRLRSVLVDLGDVEATRQAAREVAQAEPVTIVVHNAGAIREKPIEEVPVSDIDALAHLHLAAPLLLVQESLPAMRAAGFGRILNVTRVPTGEALVALARTLADEERNHGITVNAVVAGHARPEEIGRVVAFLASPASESITGVRIRVGPTTSAEVR